MADSVGVNQGLRGVVISSPAINPPNSLPGKRTRITSIGWRYQLTGPPPAGLQVSLCNFSRCVKLEGASGQSFGLMGEPADQQLHFVYYIAGKGVINPQLQVISNQVIVNYNSH